MFNLFFNETDFAQLRQELFSEPEDVHDDSLRNVVCVVPRHNLAHTQLAGQIGTVKRPKFDILFGENIFFLQNLFR